MPTYTYECKECAETQDLFHGISARPRVKCEICGGKCRRLIGTGAGIIFKGSGFYETDYKTKTGKPDSSGESKSDSKDTSKSSDGAKKSESSKNTSETASNSSKSDS